ncbi:MAG: redox-sensing transcriptional repressor Rex [Gemmatimonadaceae bacterium]
MKKVADSTVRRLSIYLRFLEEFESRNMATISSAELASRGGTTSAQVRKDLSFFGSFGKRGLGYSVPELACRLRQILGLDREWRVIIIGAGKIGAALGHYRGFRQRGFQISHVFDSDPAKFGKALDGFIIQDVKDLEQSVAASGAQIAIVAVPAEEAQRAMDALAKAGIQAVLNFAPVQLQAPDNVTVKTVNMAMELEGLSFALVNRE